MYAEGIVYMDTRKQVGRRIGAVQPAYKLRAHVFMIKFQRAQVVPVWIDRRYNQKYGHSGKQKRTDFIIVFFLTKEKVDDPKCNVCKPKQVGNNKIFTKRDLKIDRHCNNMKFCRYSLF